MQLATAEIITKERKDFELSLLFRSHYIPRGQAVGCIVQNPDGSYSMPWMEFAFVMWMTAKGYGDPNA